jgi:V/A-type H+/Na+-transporting ATPase subunit A
MKTAEIFWLNGPVLKAETGANFFMKEAVKVGSQGLSGEVIRLKEGEITVQLFEDTTGLKPGDQVQGLGQVLSVKLGPGMLGRMFDGIQRPLDTLASSQGDYILTGSHFDENEANRTWRFQPDLQPGEDVHPGHLIGEVDTGKLIKHRALVPPQTSGQVIWIASSGDYTCSECILRIKDSNGTEQEITLQEHWPIRTPRPVKSRVGVSQPLVTGQRVLDTFFPVGKGGAGALPGGFGTGKTVLEQTVAKWCDADVIVYIGCGERGNEMAGVLSEFPELEDPRTGNKLMERTVMIANTSNMPVAAREASIYTGITIAEYFRDQGLHVALFADSISRWAEALREISGRLEELPAEEGYPSYLPSRLAEFFERAGQVVTLGGQTSSLTVVGTISPPGGDFSEPVTSHSQRFVKSFWALDRERAQARFYPAINPLLSYSRYLESTFVWWRTLGGLRWAERQGRMLELLQEQQRLEKMSKIVGRDALPGDQRLTLVCAEVFVESFLRQSAFSENDRYCAPQKQAAMLELLDRFIDLAKDTFGQGVEPEAIQSLSVIRRLQRMGDDIANEDDKAIEDLGISMENAFKTLVDENAEEAQ